MKLNIKETIVVEGKSDAMNLAGVCSANFIITGGLHISKETMDEINKALNTTGVIVFTDPDGPGECLRRKISERFSHGIKHAYISVKEGKKNGDVGVENAEKSSLINALTSLKLESKETGSGVEYTLEDMIKLNLAVTEGSKKLRNELCGRLRIGECNVKTFIKKIRAYGISRETVEREISIIKGIINE